MRDPDPLPGPHDLGQHRSGMTVVVLLSLVWEVTLGLPDQWWGYQKPAMVGIFLRPWSDAERPHDPATPEVEQTVSPPHGKRRGPHR